MLDLRRHGALYKQLAWAGVFLGAGGFQLFDGIINHKVLRIHQIRYVENMLPYDISWNAAAVILLAIGLVLLRKAHRDDRSGQSGALTKTRG